MKTLAIKSSANANFKFPKSRRLQCNELLYLLDRNGFSTPVKYIVDWNDANNCFTALKIQFHYGITRSVWGT